MKFSKSLVLVPLVPILALLLLGVGSAFAQVDGVDLRLVKSVNNANPNEGEAIVYTLVISNESGNSASGIVVTDTLPAGVEFGALITPATGVATTQTTEGTTSVRWELDLADGQNASLGIEATVATGTAGQTITNTASIDHLDQVDGDNANDSGSVDLTVGHVADEPSPAGQRRAFAGTVLDEPGERVSLSKQGTDERIEILLPADYELRTPGGPRAGGFERGAQVVIQARLVDEDWVAIRVLVKPTRPNPPLTGVVLSVASGQVTVTQPDGTTQTFELPEGVAVAEGELITAFRSNTGQARGLVRAATIRDRLQNHLDRLSGKEREKDERDEAAASRRADNLIRVLEQHEDRRLVIMDEVLDRVSATARERVRQARERAEQDRSRAREAIERARDRFSDDGNPSRVRPEEATRGRGQGNDATTAEQDRESARPQPGRDNAGTDSSVGSDRASGRDNSGQDGDDRGDSTGRGRN